MESERAYFDPDPRQASLKAGIACKEQAGIGYGTTGQISKADPGYIGRLAQIAESITERLQDADGVLQTTHDRIFGAEPTNEARDNKSPEAHCQGMELLSRMEKIERLSSSVARRAHDIGNRL